MIRRLWSLCVFFFRGHAATSKGTRMVLFLFSNLEVV